MIDSNLQVLLDTLQRRRFFEECLLHDVRLVKFGFGVDLIFNYVWDSGNRVRVTALADPDLVKIRLLGVESLRLTGALTAGMITHPDSINWGLSEIARVEAVSMATGLKFSVRWESKRRLDVEFSYFELSE